MEPTKQFDNVVSLDAQRAKRNAGLDSAVRRHPASIAKKKREEGKR
jgi:hypothetical protein